MLEITIPAGRGFNNVTQEFVINEHDTVIRLEHSLVSISKWESKWHKPFLGPSEKTKEELIDYIRCMTLTQNVNPDVYYFLSDENFQQVNKYIEDPMTATTFTNHQMTAKPPGYKKNEVITSEIIYYWMISNTIPPEAQKWHLNRLLTLIRVFNVKNSNSKMSRSDTAKSNKALNAARRKAMGSKG